MATIDDYINLVRTSLGPNSLDLSGGTLYSGVHTLQLGDIYLLGTNPGGGSDGKKTIAQGLAALQEWSKNEYFDVEWDPKSKALQRNVQALLSALVPAPKAVCASNLVFMRSRRVQGEEGLSDFWGNANVCWPVHEFALNVVRPKLVIAFGNGQLSAYSFLARTLPVLRKHNDFLAGHGNYYCSGFETVFAGQPMFVAGLPHLSWYAAKTHVLEWLKARLDSPHLGDVPGSMP